MPKKRKKIYMCLRQGESEDRLERRNGTKGQLDTDLEDFDRRRSYFFACEWDVYLTIRGGINTLIGTLVSIG